MDLRLTGDLPWWLGLTLALLGAAAVSLLYRRESAAAARRGGRWLLPALRGLAVAAVIFIFTGPVLRHRASIPQPSRVMVFVDASRSMSVDDRYAPLDQKLLIAQADGWIGPEVMDTTLSQIADEISAARSATVEARRPGSSPTLIREGCEQFASRSAAVLERLRHITASPTTRPAAGASGANLTLAQQFQSTIAGPADSLSRRPIDAGDRVEVRAQLGALNSAAASFEQQLREAFKEYTHQLTTSGRPEVTAVLAQYDAASRWQRAGALLTHQQAGILRPMTAQHTVQLFALAGDARMLWDSASKAGAPSELAGAPAADRTDLVSDVQTRVAASPDAGGGAAPRTAIVLISDGQHNDGPPPEQLARSLGQRHVPVYCISIGDEKPPQDLAVADVRHNDLVFSDDQVRGSVLVQDDMPPGRSFTLKLEQKDLTLWQQEMKSNGTGARIVPFQFSIKDLVAAQRAAMGDAGTSRSSLPLEMKASIAPIDGEFRKDNNDRPFYVVKSMPQQVKVLLIDGRPRWETRYLRNTLSRDPHWQVNTLLLQTAGDMRTGDGAGEFPTNRDALFNYDLVVFGDVPPGLLSPTQIEWLRDFVQLRGGGMIFVDGQRGHLREYRGTPLAELLPVSWDEGAPVPSPREFHLTAAGATLPMLNLATGDQANASIWQRLPAPHWVAPVKPLAGAETLLEFSAPSGNVASPALIVRHAGAGQVAYAAFDETWRWRFEVGDEYHQRYWNQLTHAVMEPPYALTDKYVSLDTGPLVFKSGARAAVRARLRTEDGKALAADDAQAVLFRDGRELAAVPLRADAKDGVLRGSTGTLAPGNYEMGVRAAGLPGEATQSRLKFVVLPQESQEMAHLALNVDLLKQIATESGGAYLSEEQAHQLPALLQSLGADRVVETETKLWQSYWWFAPIIGLMGLELLLRKRNGML